MRNFFLFSLGTLYCGMGMETFAHTLHGNALMVAGLVVMLKIMFITIRSKDPYSWLYCLQVDLALLGFSGWVKDKEISFIITSVAGIAGFIIIFKGVMEAEKREKEKVKQK